MIRKGTMVIGLATMLFMLALGSVNSWAQFSSAVEGTVMDSSGAVIPTATVTLRNTETGVSTSKRVTGAGFYRFSSLPPSVYSVTVFAPGFRTVTQENVAVQVAEVRTVNVTLQVGTATTHVTVSTAPPAVQLNEASINGTIGGRTLHDLPLANRNFVSLVELSPGVTGIPQASGDIFYTSASVGLNAGGQRQDSNNFIVNGTDVDLAAGGPSGQLTVMPNVDTIQEVKVQVNNFSAEYGRNSGAQISVVTKQGTNQWHGTLSEFHRNNDLTSRTEFQSFVPVYRRNDMAGTIGGPLRKDKTFFFATVDVLRAGNASSTPMILPTPQFTNWLRQNLPNNISTFLLTKYPASVDPVSNFQTAGNLAGIDCSTLASPLATIPLVPGSATTIPCNLPVQGQGVFSTTAPYNGIQWGGRVDHMFNGSKDRIYGNILKTHLRQSVNNVFPAYENFADNASWLVNLDETHSFSPTVLNDLTLSYDRNFIFDSVGHGEVPLILIVGAFDINFTIGPTQSAFNSPQLQDELTWTHGRHSLKFGASYLYGQTNNDFTGLSDRPGDFFLNTLYFAADQPYLEPNISYDPLTGAAKGLVTADRTGLLGLFAQDDWKVKPNFTLNLGLRWEDFGNPTTKHNYMTNIVFQGGNTFEERIANAKVDIVKHIWNSTKLTNFEPRLGFAWDPTHKGKISIRGGYGIFFDRPIDNMFLNSALNPPLIARATASIYTPPFVPFFSLGKVSTPPFDYTLPPNTPIGLDYKNGLPFAEVNLLVTDPNFAEAYNQSAFFGIQYALTSNWILEADYSGSWARHLYESPDVNRFDDSIIQNKGVLVRPNTSFGVISYGQSDLNSDYNGAIFSLTKRMSSGLNFIASYTLSKAIDEGSVDIGGGNNPTSAAEVGDPQRERGLASFDARQKLALTTLWQIPAPKFRSAAATNLLGGWELSNILTLESGMPFSVTCSTPFKPVRNASGVIVGNSGCDFNADGFNYDYPDQPAFGNSLHNLSRSNYLKGLFTTAAFPAPPLGQEGDLGRDTFYGPGFAESDLALLKNIRIPWFTHEGANFQIRGEFLNAFNRVNLSGINSDMASPFFGKSTGQLSPKTIQLGLRIDF